MWFKIRIGKNLFKYLSYKSQMFPTRVKKWWLTDKNRCVRVNNWCVLSKCGALKSTLGGNDCIENLTTSQISKFYKCFVPNRRRVKNHFAKFHLRIFVKYCHFQHYSSQPQSYPETIKFTFILNPIKKIRKLSSNLTPLPSRALVFDTHHHPILINSHCHQHTGTTQR